MHIHLSHAVVQAAALYAVSTLITFAMWSVAFYYGAHLVSEGDCTFEGMIRAIMEVCCVCVCVCVCQCECVGG